MPAGRAEGCRVPCWPQSQGGESPAGRECQALPLCSPPSLRDAPILKHQDLVCAHHGGEPAGKGRVLSRLGGERAQGGRGAFAQSKELQSQRLSPPGQEDSSASPSAGARPAQRAQHLSPPSIPTYVQQRWWYGGRRPWPGKPGCSSRSLCRVRTWPAGEAGGREGTWAAQAAAGAGAAAEQGKAGLGAAAVTSSSRMMRGPFRMVRAMATRCFSPPLSFSPRSPTWVLYPAGTRAGTCCAGALRDGDGDQGVLLHRGGPARTTWLPGAASAHHCPGSDLALEG